MPKANKNDHPLVNGNKPGKGGPDFDLGERIRDNLGMNAQPEVDDIDLSAEEDGIPVIGQFVVTDLDSSDTHTFTITSQPSEGEVQNNGDGTFSFDPGSDFQELGEGETRQVSFTYTATDSSDMDNATSEVGTITITVTGSNDDPVVSAVSVAATEDGNAVTGNFMVSDADSNDTHTFTITSQPAEGSVVNNNDGSFSFDPGTDFQDLAEGEIRQVSFDYTATDSAGATSSSGTVTITVTGVNDAPEVSAVSVAATEDGNAVTGNFVVSDADGSDSHTFAITNPPAEGSVVNHHDGSFSFDPGTDFQDLAEGETRQVSFTYTATDSAGATSNGGTVTITVTGVNDAPVVSAVSVNAVEDGNAVTGNFVVSDADGSDSHTFAITNPPAEGSVVNHHDGSFGFDPGTDFQDLAEGETRQVSFDYTATDSAGATSNSGTVTITVTGVNDAPVVSAVSVNAVEDGNAATGNFVVSDADGSDSHTFAITGQPAEGAVSNNNDGSFSFDPGNDFQDLAEGETRQVSFDYTATDSAGATSSSGTVTITVTGVNDGPVITAATATDLTPVKLPQEQVVGSGIAGHSGSPSVAALADGGHIVVWTANHSANPDGSSHGVYGQRYDANGNEVGGEFLINSYIPGTQSNPSVTGLEDGRFVVVWQGVGGGGADEIYLQLFDAGGNEVGSEYRVNPSTTNTQFDPSVTALAGGGFAVSWTSNHGGDYDIYTRLFDSNGAITGELLTNHITVGMQFTYGSRAETVAGLSNGRLVSVWTDASGQDGSSSGVFARLFESNGTAVTVNPGQFKVNTTTAGSQWLASVSALEGDGFVITWRSLDGSANGIFAQRFDGDGNAVGTEFQVNSYTLSEQANPKVHGLKDGGFVIVWQSYGADGDVDGISGQRFDARGNRVAGEFVINDRQQGFQQNPDLAVREDGALVVAWLDASDGQMRQKVIRSDDTVTPLNIVDESILGGQKPDLAALADGGHIVVWMASNGANPDASGFGIYGRRFDANGDAVGDEFLVNTTTANTQEFPRVAALEGGGFVVVWQSQDGAGSGIYGQRFDNNGNAIGAEFLINQSTLTSQYYPGITALAGGGFAVSWTSIHGGDNDTYTRLYDVNGTATTPELLTNTTTNGDQATFGNTTQTVAGLANGSLVSVWTDYSGSDGQDSGIFARLLDDQGNAIAVNGSTDEFQVNTTTAGHQIEASVGALDDGGFVIAWQSPDGSSDGIFAQRFDGTGNAVGGEFQVNVHTFNLQQNARVQGLSDGGFVIIWQSYLADGSLDGILGRRFDASGQAMGGEFVINPLTVGSQASPSLALRADGALVAAWQHNGQLVQEVFEDVNALATSGMDQAVTGSGSGPEVTALADGGHLVVWHADDGSGNGIYGQRFDANGGVVGGEFLINSTTADQQSNPSAASLNGGGFVVVWQSANQDGSSNGIYGQLFDASDNEIGNEFLINQTTTSAQYEASVTTLADGGFAVSWSSDHTGDLDIYTRLYSANGTGAIATTGELLTNTTTSGYQATFGALTETVAGLANGRFVSVWSDNSGADGSNWGVFARLLDAQGNAVAVNGSTDQFPVNTTTVDNQFYASVGALNSGGFVIVWLSPEGSGNGIFAQRFDGDGNAVGGEFQVNGFTQSEQLYPKVQGLDDGGFVIIWQSQGADGFSYGIAGQRYDVNGNALGGEFSINNQAVGNQFNPSFDVRDDGALVVAWQDSTTGGISQKIFQLDPQGDIEFADLDLNDSHQISVLALGNGYLGTLTAILADSASGDGQGRVHWRFDWSAADQAGLVAGQQLSQLYGIRIEDDAGAQATQYLLVQIADSGLVTTTLLAPEAVLQGGPGVDGLAGSALAELLLGEGGADTLTGGEGNDWLLGGADADVFVFGASSGQDTVIDFAVNQDRLQLTDGVTINGLNEIDTDGDGSLDATRVDLGDGNRVTLLGVIGLGSAEELTDPNDAPVITANLATGLRPARPVSTLDQSVGPDIAGHGGTPSVAALADGGHLVVWTASDGANPDASSSGVYGRRFDANGDTVGAEFLINTTTVNSQHYPSVTGLAGGGAVVVWRGNGLGDGSGIFGQLLDASGAPSGGEFLINQSTASTQEQPSVTALAGGGFAVSWYSYHGGDADIYTRFFDAGGTATSNELLTNTTITGDQVTEGHQAETVAGLANGRLVSVWVDRSGADGSGVFARLLESDGTPVAIGGSSDEFQINTTTAGGQFWASVGALNNGGFVISWYSGGDIVARRFDGDGNALGSEFQINREPFSTSQFNPKVQGLNDGGFVIVWATLPLDGDGYGIAGQRYDVNGNRVGDVFIVNDQTLGNQSAPDLAVRADGALVVVWRDQYTGEMAQKIIESPADVTLAGFVNEVIQNNQSPAITALADGGHLLVWMASHSGNPDASGYGVYGRRFDAEGQAVDGEFLINTTTNGDQRYPSVAGLENGHVVVVWQSQNLDGSGNGIVGRLYDANGTAIGGEFLINQGTANEQIESSVTALAGGGFAVSWRSDHGGSADIYTRLYDDNGSATTNELLTNTTTSGTQATFGSTAETVVGLANGRLVSVWIDSSADGSGYGVFARLLDNQGIAVAVNGSTDEFQVNSTTASNQWVASVGALDDGGFVIAWQSPDGSNDGIFAQRFDGDGNALGGEFQVNLYTESLQQNARVQGLSDGGFVILWQSNGVDGNSWGISGRRYDAGGLALDDEFVVNTLTSGSQTNPAVTLRADGALVAVWQDSGQLMQKVIEHTATLPATGQDQAVSNSGSAPEVTALNDGGHLVVWYQFNGGSQDIFGQRFNANGDAVGGSFLINTTTADQQYYPSAAGLEGGGFVVVWHSLNQDGSGAGVYGQRYNASGVAQGSEFLINESTVGEQYDASVAALADGGFTVSWTSRQSDSGDIYTRFYDAGGNATTGELLTNTTIAGTQVTQGSSAETVAGLANGRLVSVWSDSSSADGNVWGVFARLFASDGTPLAIGGSTDEFQVNSTTAGTQYFASVGALNDGGFVIVWKSSDGSGFDIFAQRFDGDGNAVGGEFRANSQTPGQQGNARVQGLDDGGFVIIWESEGVDGNGVGIAGQRYDANGNAIGDEFVVNGNTVGYQGQPSFSVRGDGALVVAWYDSPGIAQKIIDLEPQNEIYFSDLDLNDSHQVSVLELDGGYLGTLTATLADSASGDGQGRVHWDFSLSAAEQAGLEAGQQLSQLYGIRIEDADGALATQYLLVQIADSGLVTTTLLAPEAVLRGGPGADGLTGSALAELLLGEGGVDTLTGGEGNDWLLGGDDADVFVFGANSGQDTIIDFAPGQDQLQLTDGVTINSLNETDTDGNGSLDATQVDLGDGNQVTLLGVTGITDPNDLLS
ncbi:VCBS domain-containing protein [Oceanimonas marisflavi]|uniref:VCBS domain-containing protein n=1 Tax=Oceanimonas marisflavi TaxID=2059724 RepID=UPI000D306390|nr:VCBS domain-containing protein [Oceanimonas marisflavi]